MNRHYLLLFFFGLLLTACQPNSADKTTNTNTEPKVEASTNSTSNPSNEAAASQQANTSVPVNTSRSLIVSFDDTKVKAGDSFCIDLKVAQFFQLLSMQFTVQWDPAVLRFEKVDGFQLPSLSMNNYGLSKTDTGIMTFLWIDESLQGVTLGDGASVYQLCFTATGTAGQTSPLDFVEEPTPFESVTKEEEVIAIRPYSATISLTE